MSRALITIHGAADRERASRWIAQAPAGTRVELKAAKRSLDQNSKLWASLTDVATQLPWHGQKLRPDDWKLVFMDALKRELRVVPNIDGNGFVNLGRSSSDLSKQEMSELIELILAFGAQHGVVFHDPENAEAA
jgi:NinB protein